MKTLPIFAILLLTAFGCFTQQTSNKEKLPITETEQKVEKTFKLVADYPTIKDTFKFISALRQTFDLEVHERPTHAENDKITVYRKVNLYGSDKDYYFIEYDWKDGSMAEFPWKNQLLLTTDGKLVKILSGLRFDFVTVFPKQNQFLLMVKVTAKGNGGHELYKISADTLENVYEGYYEYDVQTYDANQDFSVFEPNELKINFIDKNKDGFNDIVFTGQKLMLVKYTKDSIWYDVENGKSFSIENPAGRIQMKYIFLYDSQTGHFKAEEKICR